MQVNDAHDTTNSQKIVKVKGDVDIRMILIPFEDSLSIR